MADEDRNLTRRDFLRGTAGAAMAGAGVALAGKDDPGPRPAGSPPVAPASGNAPASSTVVLVREAGVLDANGRVVPEVLASMLDRAVSDLAGQADPVAAWKTLLKPTDTLGIKTNVWRFLATPPSLEQAIRQRAIDCGIPAAKIAIDDRGVLQNPVFRSATALINVRPLRTHHWSGVGSLLKNYIMFSPSPPDWHGDSCADLGGLWKLPACAGKTRLNVLVMLTPLYPERGAARLQRQVHLALQGADRLDRPGRRRRHRAADPRGEAPRRLRDRPAVRGPAQAHPRGGREVRAGGGGPGADPAEEAGLGGGGAGLASGPRPGGRGRTGGWSSSPDRDGRKPPG